MSAEQTPAPIPDPQPSPGPSVADSKPKRSVSRTQKLLFFATGWLIVLMPFLFWWNTWFGRHLNDQQLTEYLHDDKKPRPARFYSRALRFYQRAMQRPNAKLLVMCHHGVCRSPSLAYFFLRASGASPQKAETFVRKARPSAMIVRAYRKSCEAYLRRRER